MPIELIPEMTVMTYNCLKRNGINTLDQIFRLSEESMNDLKYMSHWKKRIINEIMDIQKQYEDDYIPDEVREILLQYKKDKAEGKVETVPLRSLRNRKDI